MSVAEKIKRDMEAGSWIRRMFDEGLILKQRYGEENVFDLTLGNPVMEPPASFVEKLKNLAEKPLPGMHRYMPNAGYPETRAAVAAYLGAETGLKITGDSIIMTCGAAGAMNVALKTILNHGDEVILLAPFFVEFLHYIANHNGVAKILPTDEGFLPRFDVIEAGIGPKTRAIIINSPNNPTGVVYSADIIRQLSELLSKKAAQYNTEIYLLSDEPYRKIIYDGLKYPSPLNYYPHSVVTASYSKDLALPGERIGYLALHPKCPQHDELINGFIFCNRILGFVNAPAMMQHLVRDLQNESVAVSEYQRKRDFLYNNLTEMGYVMNKPQGAFYIFPKSPLADDVAFVAELQQHQVLAVPGQGFGAPGYFRISYCVDDRTIEGSLQGFRKVAEKLKLKK